MYPLILIHGAWHAGWTFDRLMPFLPSTTLAPDLPGHGQNRRDAADVTLAGYADFLAGILDTLPGKVFLLGHSMSGAVISEVAERRPEKVQGLIYMSAFLLPDGVAMSRRMKEDTGSEAAPHTQKLPDQPAVMMAEAGIRNAVYEGCRPEDIDWALARVQPQPIEPFTAKVHVTNERFGQVPRMFIECTRDKAITPGMQRQMQQDLPCTRVTALPAGHMPHVEMPEALGALLRPILETGQF